MKKNILQKIFIDHYEEIKYSLHPRGSVMDNIDMNPPTEKLREKYIKKPPEGLTAAEIRSMSKDDLLDIDYFLNEDVFDEDMPDVEGFYFF